MKAVSVWPRCLNISTDSSPRESGVAAIFRARGRVVATATWLTRGIRPRCNSLRIILSSDMIHVDETDPVGGLTLGADPEVVPSSRTLGSFTQVASPTPTLRPYPQIRPAGLTRRSYTQVLPIGLTRRSYPQVLPSGLTPLLWED
ncbi:hypothetical protein EVAR_43015_1 [Eumeta japonica]|uniref:Uncharacterized protein n=1 Tax=Eumeta variegata TaxID=151549 RepID=A0A4C1XP46_EUMVA|nr:hypothetical protein EVAR_43015_1 [Eumeta japonica]